jgi:hypothetical protein
VAGLVLCVAVVVAAAGWWLNRSDDAVLPPPEGDTRTVAREAAAGELLAELGDALQTGSRAAAVQLAAPGNRAAARELAALRSNVRRLGVTDLSLRYVDENAGRATTVGPRLAERAWVGDVQLEWRLDGFDTASSRMEVTMTFLSTRDGAAFVSARGDFGDAAPLWLLERLAVARSGRALVMVADPADADVYARLANRAVVDVRKVLPRWRGELVVEVPESQDQLDRVLAASGATYDSIAAVTTPVDGSVSAGAPVHIFVNPAVFSPLGDRGAQIVMSHEAAHVATDAATSSLPTWLLEGFADYVALAHVDLPVEVTASQVLQQVRDGGAPAELPGRDDFASENSHLGASYEAAWLACRLLGERFGERRLIEFYRAADETGDTAAAFRSVLGTTEAAFTRSWTDHLRALAG